MFVIKRINNVSVYAVLVFVFNFNQYYAASHLSAASKYENQASQIVVCKKTEFHCGNEHCISKKYVCDGALDCADGSDEIYDQCSSKTCDEKYFRCDYGACISEEYKCDGSKQCSDGSDEWTIACNSSDNVTADNESKRNKRAAGDFCPIPTSSPDKTVTFVCQKKITTSCGPRNGYVPDKTTAEIKCNPNYYSDGTNTAAACIGNTWTNELGDCYKKCDPLNAENVDLKCFRNNAEISCDEESLLAGAVVYPTCRKLYTYEDRGPDFEKITCDDDGKWDHILFSCIPVCGKAYKDVETLISGGNVERTGESPWHVAIYDWNKVLICGGTIVHPNLIVTAAHCFDVNGVTSNDTSRYEVVVSKVSRDYNTTDNSDQKNMKIKEIRFSERGYIGQSDSFTADIALLILEEKLSLSPRVMPACVDWQDNQLNKNLTEGRMAKVSGWGRLGPGENFSETLMTVNLPYISRQRCLALVPADFRNFITLDKFCAGSENGPGVLQGDSGGGLLFEVNSFYFLRGIVSVKQTSETSIVAFTDLEVHKKWLKDIRDTFDKVRGRVTPPPVRRPFAPAKPPITKAPTPTPTTTTTTTTEAPVIESSATEILTTDTAHFQPTEENSCNCVEYSKCPITATSDGRTTAQVCGYNGNAIKICCNSPKNFVTRITSTTTKIPSATQPAVYTEFSTEYRKKVCNREGTQCREEIIKVFQNRRNFTNTTFLQKNGPQLSSPTNVVQNTPRRSADIASSYCEKYSNYATTSCSYNEPRRGSRIKARRGEYPHLGYIGVDSNSNRNTFIFHCVGSLISENFILSRANCGQESGTTQRAALGHTNRNSMMNNFPREMYVIEERYIHPDYNSATYQNDIGLYKLKTNVRISPNLRPGCIYSSANSLANQQLRITSWGNSNIGGSENRDLLTATITVQDDRPCANYRYFSSDARACVGMSSDGEALCLYTGSDPIQIPKEDNSCMWMIYAIGNTYLTLPQSCGENFEYFRPYVYTKLSYYLDWIQGLVWPNG